MPRIDGRGNDELRPVTFHRGYLKHPHGSVLIQTGHTRVLCAATVEESVPTFLNGTGKGWVTSEYSMLPASTSPRVRRSDTGGGRSQEIQRLIGRSLRAVTDMAALGPRTIWVDCDVIQADGGTRTAAVTGGFLALHDACFDLVRRGVIPRNPLRGAVAATSVGIVEGQALLDLAYVEDVSAEVDFNVVRTDKGQFVEIQGTAEKEPFSREALDKLLKLADRGIDQLIAMQTRAIAAPAPGST